MHRNGSVIKHNAHTIPGYTELRYETANSKIAADRTNFRCSIQQKQKQQASKHRSEASQQDGKADVQKYKKKTTTK